MARNPVTPVEPVDAVGAVRRVDSGSTYYRHLELWRIHSEVWAAQRRARQARTERAEGAEGAAYRALKDGKKE